MIGPIAQVLTEDILPALDKLRREKVQYMEWQNANKSQEKLLRFCVAYRYKEAQRWAAQRRCCGCRALLPAGRSELACCSALVCLEGCLDSSPATILATRLCTSYRHLTQLHSLHLLACPPVAAANRCVSCLQAAGDWRAGCAAGAERPQ
jgi:hypothetical protein